MNGNVYSDLFFFPLKGSTEQEERAGERDVRGRFFVEVRDEIMK